MAAPSSAALTAAGYVLNANGAYAQTFGSLTVAFTLYDTGSGGLLVTPNGDISPSDIANVETSLANLGIATVQPNGAGLPVTQLIDFSAAGGTQSFGMSL